MPQEAPSPLFDTEPFEAPSPFNPPWKPQEAPEPTRPPIPYLQLPEAPLTGSQLRDEGIERVTENHPSEVDLIMVAIRLIGVRKRELTSDDIHDQLEAKGLGAFTPNAFGAAFRKSAMEGVLEDTGRAIKSDRPSAHSRRLPVWRSLIFKENA